MFTKFDETIQANKYSKGSFVMEIVAGNASREDLKRWAIQKYFQTYYQNVVFSAIHSNSQYEDVRQYEMEQLVAEETGIRDGSDTHYNLMKRFAIAMGATEEEIQNTPIGAPVQAFLDYLIGVCKNEHFVFGILSIYVNESQTSESAIKMANALKAQYNLSDYDLEWFLVHSEADVDHADQARVLVEKYAHEAPNFETRSLQIIEQGTKMWSQLHEYYYTLLKE